MKCVVFLGPTLPVSEASRILDATYLPPAGQGDLLRAALEGPKVILLIDGYFERIPAVWHKEILFAMAQGIHVLGASSMGALRAAELADYGMEGVGEIYAAFASGALEDDDEVAVAHAAREDGFRVASDAMVNIRATISAASGALSRDTATALVAIAKGLFYPDRHFARILELGREAGLSSHELDRIRTFLRTGRIDQKRRDAITALELVRGRLEEGISPKSVTYRFEHTDAWDYMLKHTTARLEK